MPVTEPLRRTADPLPGPVLTSGLGPVTLYSSPTLDSDLRRNRGLVPSPEGRGTQTVPSLIRVSIALFRLECI